MRPEPFAFHCPACNQTRANPLAAQPADGFVSVYNQSEPRTCDGCLDILAFRPRLRHWSTPVTSNA